MPTFKALYDSPWHHPGAAWIAGALVVAAIAARRPRLAALLLLLEIEILADALFTGALSPIPPAATASTVLAIAFVILGDLRFFYLLERQRSGRMRALAEAVGWSLLVPVLSAVPRALWPSAFADSRWVFLVYELMFFGVALLALALTRRRHAPGPIRAWLTRLCAFELVQYGLWATADVIILAGAPGGDAGFGLRFVPNLMYYAGFVPFVMQTAPEEARP